MSESDRKKEGATESSVPLRQTQATVLFGDISGFTSMSEKLDPESVTDIINRCFAELEGVIHANGGTVDKYVGDAVIGFFDLGDLASSARAAADAALEIRRIVEGFRDPELPEPLGIHVGIASGSILVGEIGGKVRRSTSVTGDAVATGARLEDCSRRGQIIVDEATHEATCDRFDYGGALSFEGAGARAPLPAYELVALRREYRVARRASERREVTVLFADIVGLDAHTEGISAEQRVELLNRCFAAYESAVNDYGGEVEQYLGTRVLALFGARTAIEDAPRQAVNAAIDMRRNLEKLCAAQGIDPPLEARVGVNTGLIVAGEIGGRIRRDFTVMGDAVNVAARLKDTARAGRILIGPLTWERVSGHFEVRSLKPQRLSGKSKSMRLFEITSTRASVHRETKVKGGERKRLVRSELVGRGAELDRLEKIVADLGAGRGGAITLVGEAGMGKTRLVAEITSRALEDTAVLKGRSVPMGKGLSFHPFAEILRRWAGISEDEADPLHKLNDSLGDLFPEGTGEVLPFAATLMGIRLGDELERRVANLRGEAFEELIFRAVTELLTRLAAQRPLVLVFEDAHWSDRSSIKLLQGLLALSRAHPILFLIVCRPDYPDTGESLRRAAQEMGDGDSQEVLLGKLSDSDCDALILKLLDNAALPWATRSLMIRKAEGNPLFIEEVVLSLIDQGVVEQRDGVFHVTEGIDHVEVPGTIREVIMSRVDRLPEEDRQALQIASVLGPSFDRRVLDAVLDDEDLDDRLAELEKRQLLGQRLSRQTASFRRVALEPRVVYAFDHALIRDAVYESILQKTRKEMHGRIGAAIEQIYSDRLVDAYGMLAWHYVQGEEVEKAEEYLFKAGEEAARAAASTEALDFFRDASRLYLHMHGAGGDPRKKATLEKNIALALLNTGELTESIDHFDGALGYLGWKVPRSDLTRALSFAYRMTGVTVQLYTGIARKRKIRDWDREREAWEVLFNRGRAEITSDPTRLFFDTVIGFYRLNQIDAARIDQASALYASCATVFCYSGISFGVARRALARAKQWIRPGNIKDVFTCASMDWVLAYLEGNWNEDLVIGDELVEEALRNGQLWDLNTYIGLRCDQLLRMGRFAEAEALLEQLAEMSSAYGFQFARTNHDAEKMLLLTEQRRLDEALAAARHYKDARHEDPLIVLGESTYAKVQALRGDAAGCDAGLETAERIVGASRLPPWHMNAYAMARLRCDVVNLEHEKANGKRVSFVAQRRARRSAQQALAVVSKAAIQRPEAYRLAGRVAWILGQRERAMSLFADSIKHGERMNARPELARSCAEAARRILGNDGHGAVGRLDAPALLDRARALFEEMGLEHELAALESDVASQSSDVRSAASA